MFSNLKDRMSYANVVSTAALVIAVVGGGTAVAASVVPANSVGSRQIINNAVKSIDIKDDSLTGTDILEGSLAQVPSAANADNATNALNASNATTAGTANNVAPNSITNSNAFGTGNLGIVRGYAWNSSPSANADLTNNGYTYNRSGGAVNVVHNAAGNYTITFTGLNIGGGNVVVSAYGGANAVWCKSGGWGSSTMTVYCFNAAGALTDSSWTIAVTD